MNTDLRKAVNDALAEFGDVAREASDAATVKATKNAVKTLRSTSPGRAAKYGRGWKSKVEQKRLWSEGVVYNIRPGLTHLLEKGTAQRSTKKGYNRGKMPAQPHILKAQEKAEEDWLKTFEEGLG